MPHSTFPFFRFFTNIAVIMLMVALIPVVNDDLILSAVYIVITTTFLVFNYQKNDMIMLFFGIIALTISEYFFISTGVEVFLRKSLFGVMPLWLPILWGCAFVSITRCVRMLDR